MNIYALFLLIATAPFSYTADSSALSVRKQSRKIVIHNVEHKEQ